MDRGLYFAGFGLEFAPASKPKKAVSGGSKKKCLPPIGGCAPTLSLPLIGRDWAEKPVAPYCDTRSGLPWPPSRHGFEVLVNYALNVIELTNRFLRFPRVRQQTRGNFSYL
jgi:hypothetical protein